jgi:hypothetical protein
MSDPINHEGSIAHAVEPPGALLIGGLLGGVTFFLCALLFGSRVALAISGVSLIVALARRIPGAAAAFGVASALLALTLRSPLTTYSTAGVCAAVAFAAGLALFAYARLRQKLARAAATMPRAAILDV